jgi:type IV pilus assembly protein PilQ
MMMIWRTQRAVRALAAFGIAAVCLVLPATAADQASWDDRPPLEAVAASPAGVPAATKLVDWTVSVEDSGTVVTLTGDGGLPYEVFTLSDPPRLVLDLPGVDSYLGTNRLEVDSSWVAQVRAGQYRNDPEPVARVVVDLLEAEPYEVAQSGNSLTLRVGSLPAPPDPEPTEPMAETGPVSVAETTPDLDPAESQAKTRAEPVEVAEVLETETAETAEPTAWEMPDPQPVADLEPAEPQAETAPEPTAWEMPEPQPVTDPDPAEPQAETGAETGMAVPEVSSGYEQADFDALVEAARSKESVEFNPAYGQADDRGPIPLPTTETKTIEEEARVYTGQKISLNLVDADIKQVFRLFHEISGLNFVLDPQVGGNVTIVLDEVPWDQALDIILVNNGLDKVYVNNVIRIATTAKLAQEAAARKALRDAKELEVAPVTITRTLSYAKAKDVERVVREGILTPRGTVIVDERTNTLIIRDIPARIDPIDRLISTLDEETPQVMIEARIVEVSRDYEESFGIQWGFTADATPDLGTQTNLQFPHRASMNYELNLPRNANVNSLGFSFGNVLDSFTLDITLDALEIEGHARRLSTPKVATQNNQPAEIEQGTRIPIVTTTATEINVEFVAASLRLRVTPQITAEGTVIMEIEVENNSPDYVNTVGEVPSINTQRAQTTVLVSDGGTTVIGGIFAVSEGANEIGVPWFKDIPGLGWLFKSKEVISTNRELLIFLTPRIVRSA